MSIITCLSALLFTTAIGQISADSPSAQDTEREIRNAIHADLTDSLAGTVTFQKELLRLSRTVSGQTERDVLQQWSISFDGHGNLRAKIVWPKATMTPTVIVGRMAERSWLFMNHELLVQTRDAPAEDTGEDVRQRLLRDFLIQAGAEIRAALAAPGLSKNTLMLMVDRDARIPRATIGRNGVISHLEFERRDGGLLLNSTSTSHESITYRSEYSGHKQVNDQWVPSMVEVYRVTDSVAKPPTLSYRYSGIKFTPEAQGGSQRLREMFDVPQPGDPDIDLVTLVTTVTYDGVTYSTFGGFTVSTSE